MKLAALFLSLAMLAVPFALTAQTTYSSSQTEAQSTPIPASQRVPAVNILPKKKAPPIKPLSRIALGIGVSPLGAQAQIATNLSRHFNVRGTGNIFQYDINNISTNGFNVNAHLNLSSAGASLDIYPFPSHGLRFSPGVLFYNRNAASAVFTVHTRHKLYPRQPYLLRFVHQPGGRALATSG